jgi:ribosomal protein S1
VTIVGELYVKNCKAKDATIEVTKALTGEVVEVSHNGKIEKSAEGLEGVNHNSIISWELPLGPGREATLTYKYEVYVAH